MSREESIKKNLRTKKRSSTRTVVLSSDERRSFFEALLEKSREANAKPQPLPVEKTRDLFFGAFEFIRQADPDLPAEKMVEGVTEALAAGILGGSFVAPAKSTIINWATECLKRAEAEADKGEREASKVSEDPAGTKKTCELDASQGSQMPVQGEAAGSGSTQASNFLDGLDNIPF